ncbi:hypothetical protein [Salinisphaera hydrothermalis]|nr:hypothetical protein [Salinisphaera hydrothermalis]
MTYQCQECGMTLRKPGEYHPFAACLMFKACGDSDTVRASLSDVRAKGRADAEEKNRGDLYSIASDLLHSDELPSWIVEDHKQKTYSASTIARMAARWRDVNRHRALRIKSVIDASKPAPKERQP